MGTEISPQSAYSDVYNNMPSGQLWRTLSDDVNVNVLCRYGSVYDYERQTCIKGFQKLFHSYDRQDDTLNFVYSSSTIYPNYLTLEAWVFVEKFETYTSIYKHTDYVEFGFDSDEIIFDVFSAPKTTCKYNNGAFNTHEWIHMAVAYDRNDKSSLLFKNGFKVTTCASGTFGAMSSPAIGGKIILLGSGITTLNGYATELRVWSSENTEDNIKLYYKRRMYQNDRIFLVWVWRFNEGVGKAIKDYKDKSPLTITLTNDVEWSNDIVPVPICGNDCYFDGVDCKCMIIFVVIINRRSQSSLYSHSKRKISRYNYFKLFHC